MDAIREDATDIKLDKMGQPVADGQGDAVLVSNQDCWMQDIRNEALTEEGELFYEDETEDESYGFGLSDFNQQEFDDFTAAEIKQRVQTKLSKREFIDGGSIETETEFIDRHSYAAKISFTKNDSSREYNLDLESTGVEVVTND